MSSNKKSKSRDEDRGYRRQGNQHRKGMSRNVLGGQDDSCAAGPGCRLRERGGFPEERLQADKADTLSDVYECAGRRFTL